MVLLASAAGLSSPMSSLSWPPGQKNPFQNAPGPFIYALPNLAGTCPFSCSPDTVSFCSFHDPPSVESAEPPTASTKDSEEGEGAPDAPESPSSSSSASSSSSPLSPSDETHFELGDVTSPPCPTRIEGGAGIEPERQTEQQPQQREEPQSESSVPSIPPTTPTHSNALSSPTTECGFREGQKEEGGVGEWEEVREVREKRGAGRRKRRRNRKQGKGRSRPEHHGVGSIAPRFMGLSGIHYGLWSQYGLCPQALPSQAPLAMNLHHNAWSFAGYHQHHPSHQGGFVVPPTSPTPLFWNPIVPAPGFVSVPVA
jgi:hypothetical protein